MKKLTFKQMSDICTQHNREYHIVNQYGDKEHRLYFCGVLNPKSLKKKYSLKERTYIFSSDNKAFIDHMCGYSIFGHCRYDDDMCRLEEMDVLYYYQCDKDGKPLWERKNYT